MRKKTIGSKITNMKHFTIPTFILLKKMTAEFSDYHASCKTQYDKKTWISRRSRKREWRNKSAWGVSCVYTHRRTLMVAAYELIYLSEWQYHDESTLRACQINVSPCVYLSRGSMDA